MRKNKKEPKNIKLMSRSRSHQQKKRKKRRVLLYILLPITLLVGGLVVYGGTIVYRALNAVADAEQGLERGDKSDLRDEQVRPLTHNVSVLIVGVDERKDDGWEATRSDAMLLATFNVTDRTVNLVSIPRDTRAYLPRRGRYDKINHAFAFDGIDGTVEAVENLLNVPVDYFVEFNFQAFMDIVDSLGGIHVDVPIAFSEQDSQGRANAIHLEAGWQKLNGEEALALARTRKIDSDIFRGQRQQLIIEAIVREAISLNSFTRIGDIIDAIKGNFTTNLTVNDILSFYQYGTGVRMNMLQIEGEDTILGGVYYYLPFESSIQSIHEILYAHLHDLPMPTGDDETDTGTDQLTEEEESVEAVG